MQQLNSKINFGAGPATLPACVLAEASQAVLNYNNSGLSILEIPHRGKLFEAILAESKQLVLELAGLDEATYEVLWLQGGGRLQFAMIPMNFLATEATAGYIDSGYWAADAQQHAQQFGKTLTLASAKASGYTTVPELETPVPGTLSYLHLTTNNTIYGTQSKYPPESPVPLFADMSSDIFSEQRDYSKYDLFYAVAQKNLGAAGDTLVVLRKDLRHKIVRKLPPILDYGEQIRHQSVLNTPPVFAIYISLLTLRWIKEKGISAIHEENIQKSNLLYNEIERNTFFEPVAETTSRSKMNVVFRGTSAAIEQAFLVYSTEEGIEGIAGHRSVGGFRVSLYNAITVAQVQVLLTLMQQFERQKLK